MALGSVMLLTGDSVVNLLWQTFNMGSSLEDVFFGLFDVLKYQNVPVSGILAVDIISGVLYVLVWWFICIKKEINNVFICYSGVAIASTFWFYKQPHDNIILAVPCIAFLFTGFIARNKRNWMISLAFIMLIIGSFYIEGIVSMCFRLAVSPAFPTDIVVSIGRTVHRVFLMGSGCVLLVNMVDKSGLGTENKL